MKMGENSKAFEELKNVVSSEEPWKKKVKIIKDEKQYRVSIPHKFADRLMLEEGDHFLEFSLIMDKNEKPGFRLEATLIKDDQ